MTSVIDYIPGTSLLHRLNPVTKLALAAGIILATFLGDTYPLLIALLALTFALGAYARAAGGLVSLSKLMVPLSLIMLVLQTAFIRTGNPVALWITTDGLVTGTKAALRLLGVALQLAFVRSGEPVWWFVTSEGLVTGSKVCLRLLGVALPLVLMLMVTKLGDLANACVDVLHVPYRYAFTFTTALRFVPVFSQEMNAIMEAQTARGVEYDTKNPLKKIQLMLPLCVPLLVSSVGKTDATALAAEQRGFYLRTRESSYKRYPMAAADYAVLAASVALIVLGALF